jgi:hypothetical protein
MPYWESVPHGLLKRAIARKYNLCAGVSFYEKIQNSIFQKKQNGI